MRSFQVIETAKEKGMDELMAKRGRLKVQLEKVLRRIAEFPFFSELDMIEQVGFCLAWLKRFSFKCIIATQGSNGARFSFFC